MNTRNAALPALAILLSCLAALPCPASIFDDDFDREDHEENAGGGFSFLINPNDNLYAITLGSGVWLKHTPVFGDYFLGLFWNGIEDALYSGAGMTIRIMPHWTATPFIGAGGSYNLSLSQPRDDENSAAPSRGDSYWAGHLETGFRAWWTRGPYPFYEILARYTWSALDQDRGYWLIGLSLGSDGRQNDWN